GWARVRGGVVAGSGGAGDTSEPGPRRPPCTPDAPRRWASARRWPGRSSRLAPLRRRGAVGGELVQQRRELSLDLDHLLRLAQLGGQALVLAAQPGDLAIAGIGGLAARRLGERFERAAVALLAPLRDQRRVQALPAQQRALASLAQALLPLADPPPALPRVPARR